MTLKNTTRSIDESYASIQQTSDDRIIVLSMVVGIVVLCLLKFRKK